MTLRAQLTDLADRIPLPAETLGGVVLGAVVQQRRPWSLPPAIGPAGTVCAVAGIALVAVAIIAGSVYISKQREVTLGDEQSGTTAPPPPPPPSEPPPPPVDPAPTQQFDAPSQH